MGVTAVPSMAASTITVNDKRDLEDLDAGIDACDVDASSSGDQCTLRAAIQTANTREGQDTIEFSFPGTGTVRIHVAHPGLPVVTDPLIIDGYSAPGARVNTASKGTNAKLRIILDGPGNERSKGLNLDSPSEVSGLVIQDFGVGIFAFHDAGGSRIWGNFVGTSSSGNLRAGNHERGIFVEGPGVTVGGTSRASRNLVSGNEVGIATCFFSEGSRILGNIVGLRSDGTRALGNLYEGIQIYGSTEVVVGGDSSSARNIVSGNGTGVGLVLNSGTAPSHIRILRNSIFDNRGKGIAFVSGANGGQRAPVITSAVTRNGVTRIEGTLTSTRSTTFVLHFYTNPRGGDEGKTFLVERTVRTNSSGRASFSFRSPTKVSLGKTITATATNVAARQTSRFSGRRTVTSSRPTAGIVGGLATQAMPSFLGLDSDVAVQPAGGLACGA